MTEPLYNIHIRSLLTMQSRVGVSRVTRAMGQRIVDRMNAEYAGRITYWLEPAGAQCDERHENTVLLTGPNEH